MVMHWGGSRVSYGLSYKVASENSKMGLPEVSLGVIPGTVGLKDFLNWSEKEELWI